MKIENFQSNKLKEKNPYRMLFILTFLVLVVLVIVVVYAFFVKPTIQGYVVNKQIEAQQILVSNIIQQIQQTGAVRIPLGGNESVILVPYQEPAK